MLENQPEKVRFSMIEQARDARGAAWDDRINYLKEQFNNILDNLVPIEVVLSYLVFDKITMDKFIKIQKRKQHKFHESSQDPYIEVASKFKYSDALIRFLEVNGKEVIQRHNKVRKWARKLINVRNNLLKSLSELGGDRYIRKENFEYPLEKGDHIVQVKATEYFFKKIETNRWDIWKVNKKPSDKEFASDYELSE